MDQQSTSAITRHDTTVTHIGLPAVSSHGGTSLQKVSAFENQCRELHETLEKTRRRLRHIPVVSLEGVSKSYPTADGTVSALTNINLMDRSPSDGDGSQNDGIFPPVHQGEFIMIRGPSGGGKTTLLNMIGTIDAPTSGKVTILNQTIDSETDDTRTSDLRLKHIGFVFQTFNLVPTMSALENVELPMTLLGEQDKRGRRARAKQLLALVGLRNRVDHLPSELSGGEQQRVTIARSLANNPDLLLLDEPTGDLDTATTIEVMDLLMKINRMAGTTMIMVTHNPDIECYADRILYVADGEFERQATNECPVPLVREAYEQYLKDIENGAISQCEAGKS